jgi:hypothetical protein
MLNLASTGEHRRGGGARLSCRVVLLTVVLAALLAQIAARPTARLRAHEDLPARSTMVKVQRVMGARVVVADYELIREDFACLREASNPEIDRWLLSQAAFVRHSQLERGAKHGVHDPLPAERCEPIDRPCVRMAVIPPLYGRAALLPIKDERYGCSGWLDVKGSGSQWPVITDWHSTGTMIMEDALGGFFRCKLVMRAFDHYWAARQAGQAAEADGSAGEQAHAATIAEREQEYLPGQASATPVFADVNERYDPTAHRVDVVGAYAVLGWGMRCARSAEHHDMASTEQLVGEVGIDAECALLVRQAHSRSRGKHDLYLLPNPVQVSLERVLNLYGLSNAFDHFSYSANLRAGAGAAARLDGYPHPVHSVDWQGSLHGATVDFTQVHVISAESIHHPVSGERFRLLPIKSSGVCAHSLNNRMHVESLAACDTLLRELFGEFSSYPTYATPSPDLSVVQQLGLQAEIEYYIARMRPASSTFARLLPADRRASFRPPYADCRPQLEHILERVLSYLRAQEEELLSSQRAPHAEL